VVGQLYTSAALNSGKNPATYRRGGWVDPIAGMGILEKRTSIILTGIRTLSRPARSLFATPTHNNKNVKILYYDLCHY